MKTTNYRPLTYLACPYSHQDDAVRAFRFRAATLAAAWWMKMYPRSNVFSPITHSAPLHDIACMRGDWSFWKRIDTEYLRVSRRLVVLTLFGWEQSVGVQAEIKLAKKMKIPIRYLAPEQCGIYNLPVTFRP